MEYEDSIGKHKTFFNIFSLLALIFFYQNVHPPSSKYIVCRISK